MIRSVNKTISHLQLASKSSGRNLRFSTDGQAVVDRSQRNQKVTEIAENAMQSPLLNLPERINPYEPALRAAISVLSVAGVLCALSKDIESNIADIKSSIADSEKRTTAKFTELKSEISEFRKDISRTSSIKRWHGNYGHQFDKWD